MDKTYLSSRRHTPRSAAKSASRHLECFNPGLYFDGKTVFVDVQEFLQTYDMHDTPEARLILWSEIKDVFSDVPVRELSTN